MKTALNILIAVLILGLLGAAFYYYRSNPNFLDRNNSTSTPGNNSTSTATSTDVSSSIKVTSPLPNSLVRSPLSFNGEAKGFYFEGSFPVELLDGNGKSIATGIAQAQSEWTSPNFVPFKGTLNFATPGTATGTLVFKKDNPSGLPQNDGEFRVPVRFDLSNPTMAVKVYFSNSQDSESNCGASQVVTRIVPKTTATAKAALEELLKGPTTAEKTTGAYTSINTGVKIQSLTIVNGTAKVDFNSQLEYQVGGSCKVTAIRAQITNTLKQFSTVQNVIISINGRTEDILQP